MASRLQTLIEVGRMLSTKANYPELFRTVINATCDCLEAEGGTLYMYDARHECLSAVVAVNKELGIFHFLEKFDANDIVGLFSVPLGGSKGREESVSGACWKTRKPVVIHDVAEESEFDLSNVRKFDEQYDYKTRSILAVPLLSHDHVGTVLGVVQLVNVKKEMRGTEDLEFVEALAAILSVAIENNIMLLSTQNLLDAVVEMVSSAIDERSAVTGKHCMRVTELTMMLANAMSDDKSGPYKDFTLTEEQRHELRIAALLHDVGKIATPDIVLEKSKKLESVRDNIHYLEMRFRIRGLEAQNQKLAKALEESGQAVPEQDIGVIMDYDDFEFVKSLNTGGEFVCDMSRARLLEIASRSCLGGSLIEEDDLNNLLVQRGTLNENERKVMENHASISIRLLNKLPWPTNFVNVPEIAGKHHENCDGSGYPEGITGDEMSLLAKVLSLTDRFEGLSAPDRTYRKPKTLGEVNAIMGSMAKANQVDPELYGFFMDSGVCEEYAKSYLNAEQLEDSAKVRQPA